MGFKITHPLLPRRRLAWPLWYTSARRQHVPPDRMSGTTDTTKWPRCLLFHCVLVAFTLSFDGFLTFYLDPASIHLCPPFTRGWRCTAEAAVSWFLSVFECRSTCGCHGCPVQLYFVAHSVELISLRSGKCTFSRLLAPPDSCEQTLPRHVKLWSSAQLSTVLFKNILFAQMLR